MNFIKSHKNLIIFITIFVILMILAGVCGYVLFATDESSDKYGNRLNGIENVLITEERFNTVKEKITSNKNVNRVTANVTGRIVKVFIEVKKETDEKTIDELLNIILTNFTEEEKKFYDFETFITNEEKTELYPMIAYRHHNNITFTITKKVGKEDEE